MDKRFKVVGKELIDIGVIGFPNKYS